MDRGEWRQYDKYQKGVGQKAPGVVLGERLTSGHGGSTTNIRKEWGRKLQESYSGNGLRQGNTSGVSGDWLRNPPNFWSGADYIDAVRLRGNLLPTRGWLRNPPNFWSGADYIDAVRLRGNLLPTSGPVRTTLMQSA
ncbi:hypothetical protein QE152_g5278 [Popillia japonica]|uniref:Uncharacterized protein n=1 Tax=Popillia japonica TaxID=7064 RepID=A0AAW1MPN3_POPJA